MAGLTGRSGAVRPLVLFDIDGTLVDAGGAGRVAIEAALLEVFGTAGAIDDLRFDGLTDPGIARTLLSGAGFSRRAIDGGLEVLWQTYTARLADALAARRPALRVKKGVVELLDGLASRGAAVGLLTGNIEPGAYKKLEACGLGGRFRFGAFGSDAEDRDRLVPIALERALDATGDRFARRTTWVVGDTPRDIACARAGGVRALAVATGSYTIEDLAPHEADHATPTLADTRALLELLTALPARAAADSRQPTEGATFDAAARNEEQGERGG